MKVLSKSRKNIRKRKRKMENEVWNRYNVTDDCPLLPIFQKVIKQTEGKDVVIVKVLNKERSEKLRKECYDFYKLVIEHIDKDIDGIEVFKKVGS